MSAELRTTALHGSHVGLGARMVPFAGYEMPVQYKSVIAETKAVRESVGLFDVSHMARLEFVGAGVVEFLERVTVNDVSGLAPGRGHYSLLPNEAGGLVDDIVVYRLGPSVFRMVVNASNHAKDVAHLRSHLPEGVEMTDLTAATSMVAVQGPSAIELAKGLASDAAEIEALKLFGAAEMDFGGVRCFVARGGYTGEDGVEFWCPNSAAAGLWDALVEGGGVPCGLGSRDALRVEAGLPLYGHELDDTTSPIEAGLGWVLREGLGFLGEATVRRHQAEGAPRKLLGVRMDSKRLPPVGSEVRVDGVSVGRVTSGVYSPVLERGIGFAYVEPTVKAKTSCTVELRGKQESARLTTKRHLKAKKG